MVANDAARRLLDAADGIAPRGARLVAMTPDETDTLHRAIADASVAAGDRLPRVSRVRLQRRPGRLALSLRFVPSSQIGSAAGDPRSVAIFIGEPDAMLAIDHAAVAEAFRLSPREAEIACLIAVGKSVTEVAIETGLRESSVRSYLKAVFYKTDTRSQTALGARLRGFV